MKMKCLACGVEKETTAKEVYPYPDNAIVTDTPIVPLFAIDCRGPEWRVAIVCHDCMHKLDPDLWITDSMWASLAPITSFEKLPLPRGQQIARFNVEDYA
jgi:hypothetical protein